jgi:glutathione S-transferase
MTIATLTYFVGRGRAETTRWMLAVSETPFRNVGLTQPEDFEALRASGRLPFNQLPLLDLDGLELSQSTAMNRHLARRGGFYGDEDVERTMIDMVAGAVADFVEPALSAPFQPTPEQARANLETAMRKFGDRFEARLADGRKNVAGGRLSFADVVLAEATTHYVEIAADILDRTPRLAAHRKRVTAHQGIAAYLASPERWPLADADYVISVAKVLRRALPPHFPDADRFVPP